MFTDPEKIEKAPQFTSTDLIDTHIEVPKVTSSDPNNQRNNIPTLTDGLLSIASSPLFSPDECKKIIDNCIEELWSSVKVYGEGKIHQAAMQRLRGNLAEYPFTLFRDAIVTANADIYKFNILGVIDTDYPQVARYSKGDFFNFHTEINPMATTRKLSFLVMLNDPSEYEGGEIEFLNTELTHSETSKVGTIIVFPSFLTYKVKPVKKGKRYLITGSIHGDSFR